MLFRSAGSDDAVFVSSQDGKYPSSASVTVYRMVGGTRCAFSATARWDEYYPGDNGSGGMWRKMPHTMLAKCAEALALRKGFPHQTAGLYTADEMDQATVREAEVVTNRPQLETTRPRITNVPAAVAELAQSKDMGNNSGAIYVSGIEPKDYNGTPWWIISFSDGRSGSTFEAPIADAAADCLNNHLACKPALSPSKKDPNRFNVTALLRGSS